MIEDLEKIFMTREDFNHQAAMTGVPFHTIGTLERYFYDRLPPGSFVTSVLENDLKGAIMRADVENKYSLNKIVEFVVWYMPSVSQGSPEKVYNWLNNKDKDETDAEETE